jgi:formiminotetrahydrofolate cyclodeaminase
MGVTDKTDVIYIKSSRYSKISIFLVFIALFCICVYAKNPAQNEKPAGKAKVKDRAEGAVESKKATVEKVKFLPAEKKRDRNPFLSLADTAKIKAEEERRRRLREKAEQKARPKKKLSPFERARRLVKLQGIINNQAIVNGDPRRVGDVIFGAKIVKIGNSYVVFRVGDKLFTKRLR